MVFLMIKEMVLEYMRENEIKSIILQALSLEEVYVLLRDDHYQIIAVDSMFYDMSTLEAHKVIYAPLTKYILNNQIHSISIKIFNPKEWSEKRRLFSI